MANCLWILWEVKPHLQIFKAKNSFRLSHWELDKEQGLSSDKMLMRSNISPLAVSKKDTNHSACMSILNIPPDFITPILYIFVTLCYIALSRCRNMSRQMTYWYTRDQPIFENNDDFADSPIEVTRIPGGSDSPPCMKISHKEFETMEKANWEFLRLSLPVTFHDAFIS